MLISRKCFSTSWRSSLKSWPLRCTECLYKWKIGWKEWKAAIRHQNDRNAPQHGETRHLTSAACLCRWQSKDPWTKYACIGRQWFSLPFLQREPRPGNPRSLKHHENCITFFFTQLSWPQVVWDHWQYKGTLCRLFRVPWQVDQWKISNVFRIFQVLATYKQVSHALSCWQLIFPFSKENIFPPTGGILKQVQ